MTRTTELVRRLGHDVLGALTFGAFMMGSLVAFVYATQHSTGYIGIGAASAVLVVFGWFSAWRWDRWKPVAGVLFALVPCWTLVMVAGAPGTMD